MKQSVSILFELVLYFTVPLVFTFGYKLQAIENVWSVVLLTFARPLAEVFYLRPRSVHVLEKCFRSPPVIFVAEALMIDPKSVSVSSVFCIFFPDSIDALHLQIANGNVYSSTAWIMKSYSVELFLCRLLKNLRASVARKSREVEDENQEFFLRGIE